MATINPSQDYDIIHTLTYASSGGTNPIYLYRGSFDIFTGTVYYRAGTSGAWTSLSVSGYSTTFPITSTTMQIAHNWNKSGSSYMTPSFQGGTMTGIAISQKAVLSGAVGDNFMGEYARGCSSITTLAIPDTSGLTSVGGWFMAAYALNCNSLTQLNLPKAGWFKTNNVNWNVPSGRLGLLHGDTTNSIDQADWQALTVSGKTLHTNYIRSNSDVWLNGVSPNDSPTTTLNSPANNVSLTTTTPTLAFTATDPDGDDVSYQVQVGNADFSTLHMDVTTTTYASGTQQTRAVSPALTQGGIDYYWRVRAKDPSGSDSYGAWSVTRMMTTGALSNLQVWTGSDWKPGKVWDGSTWRGDAKAWDGSQWV